jgi:hypothetical protein
MADVFHVISHSLFNHHIIIRCCKVFSKTLFLYSAAGNVRSPTQRKRCDTVLPDQGYHTSQAVVIGESGAMVEG